MDIPDEGNTVKLSLFGSEEKSLYPHNSCCENIDYVYGYDCSCSSPEAMGKKPFAVVGGQLDIRAIDENCSSWTTLKKVNNITMQSFNVGTKFANCLRPGDDLLVTSDDSRYDGHSTFTVGSVDKATGDVVLVETMPRVFPTEEGPGEPEFAVEVALLRRDVVFTAETDLDEDWIGGHSIVYFTPTVVQTIQGVRFNNFGQEGLLGRYPIHFHKSGATSSLVSKNVIINSNQRCVFIHDTDGVTIDDNVAFDTAGHCYATETGSEQYNIFTHNLGAYTKKLTRSNGQSDSPGSHGKGSSTFWIRNMKNTFVGNVAAGSVQQGFWLEMKDKYSNQLHDEAFKDNSAHSNFHGLLTYKRGWQPEQPAVMENFKTYNNNEGFKFHITGNLKLKNTVIANNRLGIRHGVWNSGVTLEDSRIIALSKDYKIRFGKPHPLVGAIGIRASMNDKPSRYTQIVLNNVTFSDFTSNSNTIVFYNDNRLEDDMGDPMQATNVVIFNSDEANKPKLDYCDSFFNNWFMEDFDGTLGPETKGPGFLVRDHGRTKVFLPEDSCEALPYGEAGCATFCEGVCLRLVHLMPTGIRTIENTDFDKLQLTDLNTGTSHQYSLTEKGKAIVTLPNGQYDADFIDEDGNSLTVDTVEIEAFRKPRCENYVTESDFTFRNTGSPTANPTASPTKYYDKSYVLVGKNLKCPEEGRMFKKQTSTCHEHCFEMPNCNFFTFKRSACIACNIENASYLSSANGYEAYEMTSMKDPIDFGYKLWRDGAGIDKKCPSNSDRIYKGKTDTRDECYNLCKDNADCGWFTWGESHGARKHRGLCMLCQSDGGITSHKTFNTYEIIR